MRVKMTIAYDGSHFYGFQVQNSGVQTVSNRLYAILRRLGIEGMFEASGRTDRGVHATAQVLSLDIPPFWSDFERLRRAINQQALPHIYVKKIEEVSEHFHARYDARKRAYRYLVSTREPDVFRTAYIHYTKTFSSQRIAEAIAIFEGEHDFTLFSKTGSDTTHFVRTLYRARFYAYREVYVFDFEASGYLRSQIRLMVAFLLEIGYGKLQVRHLIAQLEGKGTFVRTPVAPNGLYLTRIWY